MSETRTIVNSNFYQVVNSDIQGTPVDIKPEYINGGNVDFAYQADLANIALEANIANIANAVAVANVVGIGNIATIDLNGDTANVLLGDGTWGSFAVTLPIGTRTLPVDITISNGSFQLLTRTGYVTVYLT